MRLASEVQKHEKDCPQLQWEIDEYNSRKSRLYSSPFCNDSLEDLLSQIALDTSIQTNTLDTDTTKPVFLRLALIGSKLWLEVSVDKHLEAFLQKITEENGICGIFSSNLIEDLMVPI
ncbi:hypothetical protein QE152_g8755 [Popillia japonica]|uniref:Uncharacterized protein n=1 Tax=Popillia japonica TaxID=7064 RepID=A0AAW1M255_POPJA